MIIFHRNSVKPIYRVLVYTNRKNGQSCVYFLKKTTVLRRKFKMAIPEKIDVSCQNLSCREDSSQASKKLFAVIPFLFLFSPFFFF